MAAHLDVHGGEAGLDALFEECALGRLGPADGVLAYLSLQCEVLCGGADGVDERADYLGGAGLVDGGEERTDGHEKSLEIILTTEVRRGDGSKAGHRVRDWQQASGERQRSHCAVRIG